MILWWSPWAPLRLSAGLSAAFLSPLALYYSSLLTDEEFLLGKRDVLEPRSSFRRRIRASVDLRRLQINKSTGFENLPFQLLRSPWGGGERGQQKWRMKWPNCQSNSEFCFWSPCWEKSSNESSPTNKTLSNGNASLQGHAQLVIVWVFN